MTNMEKDFPHRSFIKGSVTTNKTQLLVNERQGQIGIPLLKWNFQGKRGVFVFCKGPIGKDNSLYLLAKWKRRMNSPTVLFRRRGILDTTTKEKSFFYSLYVPLFRQECQALMTP